MKRPKYYYCHLNGLVYEQHPAYGSRYMYSFGGDWAEYTGYDITLLKVTPLSKLTVKYFEHERGYIKGFLDL